MYAEIVQSPRFYLDENGTYFPEATTFILTGENLNYLYNLLNSKSISCVFKMFYAGGGLGEHGYRYKKAFVENLPIPIYKGSRLQQQIIEAHDDNDIERAIAEIYGFSEEEVMFIGIQ